MYFRTIIYPILFFLISCQPVELLSPIDFDSSKFGQLSINANEVIINNKYKSVFSEKNIEDQLTYSPLNYIEKWTKENINIFGNQNKLIINILEASILKKEIENKDAKNYEEKTIFLYEVFYFVEFELYDNSEYLLANTSVQSTRSTTSQKYISLNQSEIIINELLNKALKDFVSEAKSMTKLYMGEYLK